MLVANAQSTLEQKRAGDKFKNVSVLSDMPAAQMGKVMNIMSASLGVSCSFCHKGTDFASEENVHKATGRKMIEMTLRINKDFFEGKPDVTCNTCHRGQSRPSAAIELESVQPVVRQTQLATKPTVDDILAKYILALGGKDQIDAVKTRHVIAKRIEPSGQSEPEELWQTATGRSRMVTQYGTIKVVEGFDGKTAWKHANGNAIELKPDEVEQIRIETNIAVASSVSQNHSDLTFRGLERIDSRYAYLVSPPESNQSREQFYFDVQSGLLSRRKFFVPTFLGDFEYQVDYLDYREFGGVMMPTKIRFAVPNITWTRVVTTVETNVHIEESQFHQP